RWKTTSSPSSPTGSASARRRLRSGTASSKGKCWSWRSRTVCPTRGKAGEKHTVTWTLKDLGNGLVSLHLEQTGISGEPALDGAKYGWGTWIGRLERLLEP